MIRWFVFIVESVGIDEWDQLYKTKLSVTAGQAATRGLFDLVSRTTWARIFRAELQNCRRVQRAKHL